MVFIGEMMADPTDEWIRSATLAWLSAEQGQYEQAIRCYQYCDDIASKMSYRVSMNPALSLLRHTLGSGEGFVSPLPPAEDSVLTLEAGSGNPQHIDAQGMKETPVSFDINYKPIFPEYILKNLKDNSAPHIMVLSSGRCGTVSLYHLLEKTHYLPYHTYFFHVPTEVRCEMMCRLIDQNNDGKTEKEWLKTRIAEWIGANNLGRPIAALSHLDTIFAPVFAALFPNSKFIYLRRYPEKTFQSFVNKNQWNDIQLRAIQYKFEPFKWRDPGYDKVKNIAWYLKFTENFSRSFGKGLGGRFIELSSDKLFAQDLTEIMRLIEFTGIDLLPNDLVKHFSNVYNEKGHKVTLTDLQLENATKVFRREYAAL